MKPPPVRSAAMLRYLRTKAVAFWVFPFLVTAVVRLALFDAVRLFAISLTVFTSAVVVGAALPVLAHRRATHGLPVKYLGLHSGGRLKILWWPLVYDPPSEAAFLSGAMADLRHLLTFARLRGIMHISAYSTELRNIDFNRVLRHLGLDADWEATQKLVSLSTGAAVATGLSAFPEFLQSLYVLGRRALGPHTSGARGRRQRVREAYHRHLGVPELWVLTRRTATRGLSPENSGISAEGKEDPAPDATSPNALDTGG